MNTETTIIGIALSGDRNALIDLDNIHPHHFADTRNAAIWQLIEDYKQKNPGQGLTPDLLLDKLPSITTAHVTPDYLLDTMNGVHGGHINLAGVHANKLIDDTARRHLHDACTRGLQIIEAGGDPSDAEASIRELLNQVSTGSTTLVNNDTCLTQITDFTTKATPFTAAFIDYIGLINAAPGDRRARWELIGEYTRSLKNLAKDLQIPIFAIAQLGRQAEQSPGGELQLSHLRESGNIEQDANVVLLLSCPHENGVTDWTRADIHVAKNREGRTGHVLLEREGDYSRLNHLGWTPKA